MRCAAGTICIACVRRWWSRPKATGAARSACASFTAPRAAPTCSTQPLLPPLPPPAQSLPPPPPPPPPLPSLSSPLESNPLVLLLQFSQRFCILWLHFLFADFIVLITVVHSAESEPEIGEVTVLYVYVCMYSTLRLWTVTYSTTVVIVAITKINQNIIMLLFFLIFFDSSIKPTRTHVQDTLWSYKYNNIMTSNNNLTVRNTKYVLVQYCKCVPVL